MLIEQPPRLYRMLFPEALWRIESQSPDDKTVYLTFDDGPIPETTPWILDLLDHYNIKATFFCVGDNVRKYPDLFHLLIQKGHHVGNHTFNHLQGLFTQTSHFIDNVEAATHYIQSPLFRPPHGHMRIPQTWRIKKDYKIVMWDVVTRDYSKFMNADQVFGNVKKLTRNGSIIVFHDSLKAQKNMMEALPKSIEWLLDEGYQFKLIDYSREKEYDTEGSQNMPIPEFVVSRNNRNF